MSPSTSVILAITPPSVLPAHGGSHLRRLPGLSSSGHRYWKDLPSQCDELLVTFMVPGPVRQAGVVPVTVRFDRQLAANEGEINPFQPPVGELHLVLALRQR